MKLWLVESDASDYDDCDAMVIRSETPEEAERIVREDYYRRDDTHNNPGDYKEHPRNEPFPGFEPNHKVTVTELTAGGVPGIIIACYHAG